MEIASHGLTGERVDGIGVLLEVGMILATIQTTLHIVAVITKPRNCICFLAQCDGQKRLIIQLFTTIQILCY